MHIRRSTKSLAVFLLVSWVMCCQVAARHYSVSDIQRIRHIHLRNEAGNVSDFALPSMSFTNQSPEYMLSTILNYCDTHVSDVTVELSISYRDVRPLVDPEVNVVSADEIRAIYFKKHDDQGTTGRFTFNESMLSTMISEIAVLIHPASTVGIYTYPDRIAIRIGPDELTRASVERRSFLVPDELRDRFSHLPDRLTGWGKSIAYDSESSVLVIIEYGDWYRPNSMEIIRALGLMEIGQGTEGPSRNPAGHQGQPLIGPSGTRQGNRPRK